MPAKAAPAKAPQPAVYEQVESLLRRYEPPFTRCSTGKVGSKRSYGLESKKDVTFAGRKFPSIYFAGVIEQKAYVGFYFFLIYVQPETKKQLAPTLLKLLKGKSCFYLKKLDDQLLNDIKAALDLAVKLYKKKGGFDNHCSESGSAGYNFPIIPSDKELA